MKFLVLDGQKQLKFFETVTASPALPVAVGLDVGAATRHTGEPIAA